VKKGDTLSMIASNNGFTVKELLKLNNIEDPNKISVGEKLIIKK
jgi:LysM repeat protein